MNRVPLHDRGPRGEWSKFEALLFNSVGDEIERLRRAGEIAEPVLFSKRLAITQLMLDAFDEHLKGRKQ